MAELINLRRARKRRARDEKRKAGDRNAAAFGITRSERERTEALNKMAERHLDATRRDRDGEDED